MGAPVCQHWAELVLKHFPSGSNHGLLLACFVFWKCFTAFGIMGSVGVTAQGGLTANCWEEELARCGGGV